MMQIPRPFQRLLVANRGEIAARIVSAARELDLETFTVYTDNDVGHTHNATHALRLSSPSGYLDIPQIVELATKHEIDAVHPGYGFLSESADFAKALTDVGVQVIGPGAEILAQTGDKLQARILAEQSDVPVLPALTTPTDHIPSVRAFAEEHGLPIMVKAVDGGGGRGIRLVRRMEDLSSLVKRAIEESPSKHVFAEKAAIDGFRHIEVQIIGDGNGNVLHLWERECSIQRRYQKVVELAPSTINDRRVVKSVIDAAMKMAEKIRYRSLGTFEFLANPTTGDFFFLEINPRLQVEHTITESICAVDIVKAQLLLAQGCNCEEAGLFRTVPSPLTPPEQYAMQLRLTAEDPDKGWALSIGRITSFRFPSGNGVRVDTALVSGAPAVVSADFDSVVAKIVVTASTWTGVVNKARRALEDTAISGVKTNLNMLLAIVTHPDLIHGRCDTQWLEARHSELLEQSHRLDRSSRKPCHGLLPSQQMNPASSSISTSSTLFRKDDAWALTLLPKSSSGKDTPQKHHLHLEKVLRNDFPSSFSADIAYTTPDSQTLHYTMDMRATSATASALSSQHRQGSTADPSHIIVPFSGKLVEVLVDEGDIVRKDDVICVVKQMKMELEVRSHKAGRVTWVTEAEDDEDIAEGLLAAVVEDEAVQSKL